MRYDLISFLPFLAPERARKGGDSHERYHQFRCFSLDSPQRFGAGDNFDAGDLRRHLLRPTRATARASSPTGGQGGLREFRAQGGLRRGDTELSSRNR